MMLLFTFFLPISISLDKITRTFLKGHLPEKKKPKKLRVLINIQNARGLMRKKYPTDLNEKKKKDDVLFIKLFCYSIIRPQSNSLGLFYQAVLDCFQEFRGGKNCFFSPFCFGGSDLVHEDKLFGFYSNRNKDMMEKKERKSAFTLRSLNFPFISNCPDFSG